MINQDITSLRPTLKEASDLTNDRRQCTSFLRTIAANRLASGTDNDDYDDDDGGDDNGGGGGDDDDDDFEDYDDDDD